MQEQVSRGGWGKIRAGGQGKRDAPRPYEVNEEAEKYAHNNVSNSAIERNQGARMTWDRLILAENQRI